MHISSDRAGPRREGWWWSLLVLAGFTVAGWAFGALDSRIPSPSAVGVFWLGNLGSTWLVLPFVGGWVQRCRGWSSATGAASCVAAMTGFFLLGGAMQPAALSFAGPWLLVGALTGAVWGLFGERWGRTRSLLDGLALAVPFVLEPFAWAFALGYTQGPYPIWYVEVAVGGALVVWVTLAHRRRFRAAPP